MPYHHLRLGAVAATALAAALPASAENQAQNCAPHATIVERLATGYGESRQSIALGSNNTVVEIFASLDTGTWTITMTRVDGLTCLVAAGEAFEHVEEQLPGTDQPA